MLIEIPIIQQKDREALRREVRKKVVRQMIKSEGNKDSLNTDVLNMIILPSLVGSSLYIKPLIEHFQKWNEEKTTGSSLSFFLDVFVVEDDRVKVHLPTESERMASSLESSKGKESIQSLSIEDLAENFAKQIIRSEEGREEISGPCVFLGWSFAGCLARQLLTVFENLRRDSNPDIARKAQNIEPYIILIDTPCPSVFQNMPLEFRKEVVVTSVNDVIQSSKISSEGKEKLLQISKKVVLSDQTMTIEDFINDLKKDYHQCRDCLEEKDKPWAHRIEYIVLSNIKALCEYAPNHIERDDDRVTMIVAEKSIREYGKQDLGWLRGESSENSNIVILAVDHFELFSEQVIKELFDTIRCRLEAIMLERNLEKSGQQFLLCFRNLRKISLNGPNATNKWKLVLEEVFKDSSDSTDNSAQNKVCCGDKSLQRSQSVPLSSHPNSPSGNSQPLKFVCYPT